MLSTLNLKPSAVDWENENSCAYSIQLPSVHSSYRLKFYSILFKEQFRCNVDKMHHSGKLIQNVSYLELFFGGGLREQDRLHLLLLTVTDLCSYLLHIEMHLIKKCKLELKYGHYLEAYCSVMKNDSKHYVP